MNGLKILLVATLLAGCAAIIPPPSTAMMPLGALGSNGDPDIRSLQIAAYDFAHPILNDPAEAADAIAALDYMGGKLNSSSRWIDMDGLWAQQMLQSRQTMRRFVGISEAAPSQAVVDTMLNLAQAYRSGNQAGIQRLLSQPLFTAPPPVVQARLDNIPLIASVNSATSNAVGYAYPIDNDTGG
jgi:hypothetical protein